MLVQHHYQDKGKYSFTGDSIVASWTPVIEWLPRWLPQWKFQNLCHQGIVVQQYEGKQHCYQGNTRSPSENGCHSKKVVAKLVVKVQITMKVCCKKKKKKNKQKYKKRKVKEEWLKVLVGFKPSAFIAIAKGWKKKKKKIMSNLKGIAHLFRVFNPFA